jgi:hypothetical protein
LIKGKNSYSRRLKPAKAVPKTFGITTKETKEHIRKQPKAVKPPEISFIKGRFCYLI